MKKERKTIPFPEQSVDSLLDVLTNTVGVLMFIGIFTSLTAIESSKYGQNNQNLTRIPPYEIKGEKYHFELKDNQIFDLTQASQIVSKDDQVTSFKCQINFPVQNNLNKSDDCPESGYIRPGFKIDTPNYEVKINKGLRNNRIVVVERYEPKKNGGIAISNFESTIDQIATERKKTLIVFWVRADSFSVFQEVKQIIRDKGFMQATWEPLALDEPPITFPGYSPIDRTFPTN